MTDPPRQAPASLSLFYLLASQTSTLHDHMPPSIPLTLRIFVLLHALHAARRASAQEASGIPYDGLGPLPFAGDGISPNGREGAGLRPNSSSKKKVRKRVNACAFRFSGDALNRENPDFRKLPLTTKLWSGSLRRQRFEDALGSGRSATSFSFSLQLMVPVNPALCRWRILADLTLDVFRPADDYLHRKPLSSAYGLPDIRCMESVKVGKTTSLLEQRPITQFTRFTRLGALLDPFSESVTPAGGPYCGSLVALGNDPPSGWIKFTGMVSHRVNQVLECQKAEAASSFDYEMVPLFQADCSRADKQRTVPYLSYPAKPAPTPFKLFG